jgi:cation channel sperm-associated protein subunit beta
VLYHKIPLGFQSSVIAELIDPFAIEEGNESSCLFSSLSIQETNTAHYQLVLDLQSKCTHIKNEKNIFGEDSSYSFIEQ